MMVALDMSDLPDHIHEGCLLSRAFACQNQLMVDSLGQAVTCSTRK